MNWNGSRITRNVELKNGDGNKLGTYTSFKKAFEYGTYHDFAKYFQTRNLLTKLRTSAYILEIGDTQKMVKKTGKRQTILWTVS